MRNETQEMSRHHGGESSVRIERQQMSGGTAAMMAVLVMLVKAEWNEVGPLGMGGLGMLPVYWLIMTVVTLGARDALRRAMSRNTIVNTGDPLKLGARELVRLQGLTRAAMRLAAAMSVLFMGAATAALVLPGMPFSMEFFYEFQISSVVFVWCLGVAALWVLFEIVMEYLRKVGDGRFAAVLELVVAAVFGVIVIVPVLGSGGIALIGVSAVFLIGLVVALARMHRVKPWMPEGGLKELLRETPLALLGTLLYAAVLAAIFMSTRNFVWGGDQGTMGFYRLFLISAVLGLLMMEMAKPARRLDREQTAPLAAGVSAFIALIGLILLGAYYGLISVEDPYGLLYRMQFFFAAGFVLMVMYAKQNVRLVVAEGALFFGIGFALMDGNVIECILRCLGFGGMFALLCLREWAMALKRLGKWLKTI